MKEQNQTEGVQEEDVVPLIKTHKNNVLYMIKQCLQTASKNRVPSTIFSYLEIFELLRLKTANKDFRDWIEAYFQYLDYLDLSPFFGYGCSENHITDITFAHAERSFCMVFRQLCPNRTKLSLAYSTQLTCSALKHFLLPDNWSEKLVGLNLYFCTKLKRVDLADTLCQYATDLVDINLSMIHKLSITGLNMIMHNMKQLKRLSIAGSLKSKYSDEELNLLEDIEGCIAAENTFENLMFLDCRQCSLLQKRQFWMPANEEESKYRAMVGVFQRGKTWILGPESVTFWNVSQLQCLYPDCGTANPKSAMICKSCQRRLFLADFLKEPSSLFLEHIS